MQRLGIESALERLARDRLERENHVQFETIRKEHLDTERRVILLVLVEVVGDDVRGTRGIAFGLRDFLLGLLGHLRRKYTEETIFGNSNLLKSYFPQIQERNDYWEVSTRTLSKGAGKDPLHFKVLSRLWEVETINHSFPPSYFRNPEGHCDLFPERDEPHPYWDSVRH